MVAAFGRRAAVLALWSALLFDLPSSHAVARSARTSVNNTMTSLARTKHYVGINAFERSRLNRLAARLTEFYRRCPTDPCAMGGGSPGAGTSGSESDGAGGASGGCPPCPEDMEDALADAAAETAERPKAPSMAFHDVLSGLDDWVDYYRAAGRVDPMSMAAEQAIMYAETLRQKHKLQEMELKDSNTQMRGRSYAALRKPPCG